MHAAFDNPTKPWFNVPHPHAVLLSGYPLPGKGQTVLFPLAQRLILLQVRLNDHMKQLPSRRNQSVNASRLPMTLRFRPPPPHMRPLSLLHPCSPRFLRRPSSSPVLHWLPNQYRLYSLPHLRKSRCLYKAHLPLLPILKSRLRRLLLHQAVASVSRSRACGRWSSSIVTD